MTSDSSVAMMATIRSRGRSGVRLGAELQVLLTALFFLATTHNDVRCITTANAQPAPAPEAQVPLPDFLAFQQYEADALNAVLKNWTSGNLNQQLSGLLNWSPQQHPCNMSTTTDLHDDYAYEGAWRGVFCTPFLERKNSTGNYYTVSVTGLTLGGSCVSDLWYSETHCDFRGIEGVLPSEIARLTNLTSLNLRHHPKLRGGVPLQIWRMPKLQFLLLVNNSLEGPLPSDHSNLSSTLFYISLEDNNFSGRLQVSSEGTLFSPVLQFLFLQSNQLDGPLDFQTLLGVPSQQQFDLSHNNFSGTFSTGPYFNPFILNLSHNAFTTLQFSNYSGKSTNRGLGTVYMPYLMNLYVNDNQLSGSIPKEISQMPSLTILDLSGNNLAGSFPTEVVANLPNFNVSRNKFTGELDFQHVKPNSELTMGTWNFSNNHFDGKFSPGPYINPQELDISNNSFNHISFDVFNGTINEYMPALRKLNIENNKFSGEFPNQILKAPMLETLYAGQNRFNILHLPDVKPESFSLFRFGVFLTNNNFEGVECAKNGPFAKFNLEFSNYLFLAGNPYCKNIDTILLFMICRMSRSHVPLLNVDAVAQRSFTKIKIIIGTTTSTFGLILFIIAIYVWKLMRRIKSLGTILREFEKREVKPNLYSYKDIKLATKNFDKRNKLGEGGFGVVYKGVLSDGSIVAVKKLTISSSQMLSEFLNEVAVISGLKHRNLVKLKGCCLGDGNQRILVFEYVENKNLAEALSLSDDLEETFKPLHFDWPSRFNIIVGIARGLTYLHEELQSPIIHRDIKATNILLDKDYNPKIADFGLAYLFPTLKDKESHLTMVQVAGTRGYCAPEYVLHGHMSTVLDVYSFGILILEIVSGRKCIDPQKIEEEVILQEWAWKLFEAQTSTALIDPRMKHSSLDEEAIIRVISVALACVQYKAAYRPKMHDVVLMLLGNMLIGTLQKQQHEEEALGGMASSSNIMISNPTSSWEDNDVYIDESSLLSNSHEIEMSVGS